MSDQFGRSVDPWQEVNIRHPEKFHLIVSKPFSSKNHFGLNVFGNLIRNIFNHLRAIIRIIREKFVFWQNDEIYENIYFTKHFMVFYLREITEKFYHLVTRKRDGFLVTCLINWYLECHQKFHKKPRSIRMTAKKWCQWVQVILECQKEKNIFGAAISKVTDYPREWDYPTGCKWVLQNGLPNFRP